MSLKSQLVQSEERECKVAWGTPNETFHLAKNTSSRYTVHNAPALHLHDLGHHYTDTIRPSPPSDEGYIP